MRRPAAAESRIPRPHASPARRLASIASIVERLGGLVIAARHRDVRQDQQRPRVLDQQLLAGAGGGTRFAQRAQLPARGRRARTAAMPCMNKAKEIVHGSPSCWPQTRASLTRSSYGRPWK